MNQTIQQQWESYFNRCYPEGCPEIQERETKTAFYAGCLIMLTLSMNAADQPMEQAQSSIMTLRQECLTYLESRLAELVHHN